MTRNNLCDYKYIKRAPKGAFFLKGRQGEWESEKDNTNSKLRV